MHTPTIRTLPQGIRPFLVSLGVISLALATPALAAPQTVTVDVPVRNVVVATGLAVAPGGALTVVVGPVPAACVALGPGNFDESVPVSAGGAFLAFLAFGTTTTLAVTSGGEVSVGPITGFINDGATRDACLASTTPVTLTYTPPQTAAEQLTELRAAVQGVGPGTSLADKVQEAQASLAVGNLADTCGTLDDFIHEVQTQAGKGVPAAQAPQLVATATHIQAVLGCG